MNSHQLKERFCRYSEELAQRWQFEKIGRTDPMAMLFGENEVVLDVVKRLITLPGMEPMECDAIEPDAPPEWYALCKDHKEKGWSVILGYGDPYGAEWAEELPGRNGVIFATPGTLTLAEARPGNRAQRRASRKSR
jgi:hypothetical protein